MPSVAVTSGMSVNFCRFHSFPDSEAINYLLCCVHLDAKFSVMLIHDSTWRHLRNPRKQPGFNGKEVRGNLGGCKFRGS